MSRFKKILAMCALGAKYLLHEFLIYMCFAFCVAIAFIVGVTILVYIVIPIGNALK